MKFLDIVTLDDRTELMFNQAEKPQAGAGELLVAVKAIGVNRADILQRQGKYPPPKGESTILGLEICGEVVQADDTAWVGKTVFGLVAGGAYAEYCLLKVDQAFVLPKGLSVEQGAGIAEVFLTAYQAIFAIGQLQPSQKNLLIHAGASGVGTAAIQLAKAMGMTVAVTVGNQTKQQFCQKLGADIAINYHTDDFVQVIKSEVKGGIDLVLDCVAGPYISKDIDCLRMDGKIVVIAMLGGRFVESLDIAKMLAKRITLVASTLRNRSVEYKADLVRQFKIRFSALLASGEITPVIDKVYDWQDVMAAHAYIEQNQNIGKVILRVKC